MWYVYVLRSSSLGIFYIGCTEDLKRRLQEHLSGKTKTTSRSTDWFLIYYEASRSKKDALDRERQLKTGFGRGYIRKRIQDDNLQP